LLYSRERVAEPKGASEAAPAAGSTAWNALSSGGFAQSPKTAIAARVKRRSLLSRPAKRLLGRGALYFFVGLILLWSLAPVVWLFICSVSNQADLVSRPFRLIPRYPVISNYMDLFFGEIGAKGFQGVAQARKLHAGFANSIQICLAVTAINLAIGSLAGYAYARFARFWFMRSTLIALLLTRMIPGLTIVVPFFFLFSWANLLDTKTALVITYTAFTLPLVVWILRGYFETIPANLERAASVDGCTRLQSLYRVVLPVSLPGIVAAGIFSFVVAWNEFLFALILTKSPNAQPITLVLSGFATQMFQMGIGQGAVFAASVVAILPPTIIAFVLQRYLIQGMLSGSAKG